MKNLLRAVAALALACIAAIHYDLYARDGYHYIPTIGPLFVMTTVVAAVLAVAFAVRPHWTVALVAIGFSLSTLGGYILSLELPKGIFLFHEPNVSTLGALSIASELVATFALAGWAAHDTHHRQAGQALSSASAS